MCSFFASFFFGHTKPAAELKGALGWRIQTPLEFGVRAGDYHAHFVAWFPMLSTGQSMIEETNAFISMKN